MSSEQWGVESGARRREWQPDGPPGATALLAREVEPEWGKKEEPGDARASGGDATDRLVPAHYLDVESVVALTEDDHLDEVAHQIMRRVAHLGAAEYQVLARAAHRDTEAEFLPVARECTAHRFQREVQRMEEAQRLSVEERERRRHQRRRLTVSATDGGMYRVSGLVAPDVGAFFKRVLEAASDVLFNGDREWSPEAGTWGLQVEEIKPEQRWADALHLVLEQAMRQGSAPPCIGEQDAADDREPAPGDARASTPEAARRLTCDSALVRVVEPHHIKHWALGGKTSLSNLVLLCRRHHKMVHEGGFRVRMGAGQVPEFFNRKGIQIPDRPPPAPRLARNMM